ncbi:MAG: hypothetical protein WD942_04110 [Dehalococcoidia bacterium]
MVGKPETTLPPEVAGAMAKFWHGGAGPTHSAIATAFALAGYTERADDGSRTKQDRVLYAIRTAPRVVGEAIVEELLNTLRVEGYFSEDHRSDDVEAARRAFKRGGHALDDDGFVAWAGTSVAPAPQPAALPKNAEHDSPVPEPVTSPTVATVAVPTLELLIDALRRLPSATVSLRSRRHKRPPLHIRDEYDVQDVVEFVLRGLYNDVRPEERTPSTAGSSSTIDFLLRDDAVAIEVKVTAPGRAEKQIKPELLVDIEDYQKHPDVRTLVIVVYDLASTYRNPVGFETDLTGSRGSLDVHVLVVGWTNPGAPPAA